MEGLLKAVGLIYLRRNHLGTFTVRRKHFKDKYTPQNNPGIQRRLKLIADEEHDLEKADIDHQSLEDLDQDFLQAADLNDEALSEIESIARRQRLKITERKYFKLPKEPSMLTWSEKQQIIHLHQQDPERWSPEVLAESFPASPAIIKKILKNKWKPLTAQRLKDHDRKVSENWIAFHKGELEVHDPKLKAHLAKFDDRRNGVAVISDEEAARITEITLPKPKKTEFLSLVTSFKPKPENEEVDLEKKRLEDYIQPPRQIGEVKSTNVVDSSGTHYTLDLYRERLSKEFDTISEDREEIKAVINSGNKNSSVENSAFESYVAPSERFKPDAVVRQKSKKSVLQLVDPDSHPEKITIPKDHWKPGLVYRVNDCFYNDQGNLLYRVPGLKVK